MTWLLFALLVLTNVGWLMLVAAAVQYQRQLLAERDQAQRDLAQASAAVNELYRAMDSAVPRSRAH